VIGAEWVLLISAIIVVSFIVTGLLWEARRSAKAYRAREYRPRHGRTTPPVQPAQPGPQLQLARTETAAEDPADRDDRTLGFEPVEFVQIGSPAPGETAAWLIRKGWGSPDAA